MSFWVSEAVLMGQGKRFCDADTPDGADLVHNRQEVKLARFQAEGPEFVWKYACAPTGIRTPSD